MPVTWTTNGPMTGGQFSIWVVSPSNSWYVGKIVPVTPGSTSYADSVVLNVPGDVGYRVYVFYRALPTDAWSIYGLAPGTVTVAGLPVVTVTAPVGTGSFAAGSTLPVTWSTNFIVTSGQFSIWVVSTSNSWYIGKIVAANPASSSYADSVVLSVPVDVGYSVYVFYRALPTDPWVDYGLAPGTFSVF